MGTLRVKARADPGQFHIQQTVLRSESLFGDIENARSQGNAITVGDCPENWIAKKLAASGGGNAPTHQ